MSRLTDDDRFLIAEARRIGPALRDLGPSIGGDRERLAADLLVRLADLAERLDGQPAGEAVVAPFCRRCRRTTRSVPCERCGKELACGVCGRCPDCDGPVLEAADDG